MRRVFPVDIGANQSPGKAVALSECVNLMPYVPESPGAASSGALITTDGVTIWNTAIPDNSFTFDIEDNIYGIWNNNIYELDLNGAPTLVVSGPANFTMAPSYTWAYNTLVVCFCRPNGSSFFWDIAASTLVEITDAVFQGYQAEDNGVRTVTSIDGYFVFNTQRNVFKTGLVTDADSGTSFDALDFATAEYKPDLNVAVKNLKGELHVFGETTMEVWANIGGTGFPFQRIDGATIEKGLGSKNNLDKVEELDNSFVFVGRGAKEGYSIWRATGGGGATRISNKYVDSLIATVQSTTFGYMKDGKFFFGVTAQNGTIFIDLTETALKGFPVWHYRQIPPVVYDSDGNYELQSWGPEQITYGHERMIVDGRYYLDANTYSNTYYRLTPELTLEEATIPATRFFTAPYLQGEGDDVYVSRVELRMKNGVGNGDTSSEIDLNPTVRMYISDDQGRTWKDFGSRAIGRSGKTLAQVVWNRGCGRSPNYRLFRFTTENSVETVFLDLVLDIERGGS
jgi:hypothetical protein